MRLLPRSTHLADKLIFLKQVPLCAHMTDQELIAFSQYLRLREYARGQIVFEQGDLGHTLYIILHGKVRVFRLTSSGLETTLTILGKGDLVGEFAVIDQHSRSASACAIGKCALLQMSAETFFGHLREQPNPALRMMHVLVAKTRWTAAYAETIALSPGQRALQLQARPFSGCHLRVPAKANAQGISPPHCRDATGAFFTSGPGTAQADRPALS